MTYVLNYVPKESLKYALKKKLLRLTTDKHCNDILGSLFLCLAVCSLVRSARLLNGRSRADPPFDRWPSFAVSPRGVDTMLVSLSRMFIVFRFVFFIGLYVFMMIF